MTLTTKQFSAPLEVGAFLDPVQKTFGIVSTNGGRIEKCGHQYFLSSILFAGKF